MVYQLIEVEWRLYASVNYAIIGSDNGLSPEGAKPLSDQCLNIVHRTLGNKVQWNCNKNTTISIKYSVFKMSPAKCRPFCLGLNVLVTTHNTCGTWLPINAELGVYYMSKSNSWRDFPHDDLKLISKWGSFMIPNLSMSRNSYISSFCSWDWEFFIKIWPSFFQFC